MLEMFEIVPEAERALYGQHTAIVLDPAKRRELKLNQWRKERDLKIQIDVRSFASFGRSTLISSLRL